MLSFYLEISGTNYIKLYKYYTESVSSVSYVNILLEMDIDGNLITKLYDKREDKIFYGQHSLLMQQYTFISCI